MKRVWVKLGNGGFTLIELLIATIVFAVIVVGITGAYQTVTKSYKVARQLNEIYSVLSACPEIDRALDYDSVTNSTNCFPNNTIKAEGNSGFNITYSPTLSVTPTTSLGSTDPLYNTYDSKVLDIQVGFPDNTTVPPLKLRMLITRNGIGQL